MYKRQGKNYLPNKADWLDGRWKNMQSKDLVNYQRGETWIKPDTMAEIAAALTRVPDGFNAHKTVTRLLEAKAKTVSYTHLRAHETVLDTACRLLLEKKTVQVCEATTTRLWQWCID